MRRAYSLWSATLLMLIAAPTVPAQTPPSRSQTPAVAAVRSEPEFQMPAGNAEHGKYIAEHVAMCVECHSGRDHEGNILASEKYDGAPLPFVPPSPDWAT